jgi:hypothetical protein
MANLRRKVENLGQWFYCPIHRDEPLLCSHCDLMELSDEEWDELGRLLEKAGFFNRDPVQSHGVCWCCHDGILACLQCIEARGDPPEMDLMDADAIDRLQKLGAKLIPPWL